MPTSVNDVGIERRHMTKDEERELESKVKETKRRFLRVGLMHPGSMRPQYNVCGNPSCRCKDKTNPVKHGPYYNLSFTFKGKNSTKFIREGLVENFKQYVANYRDFRNSIEILLELHMKLIELRSKRK